ncbi:MAG TPA: MBL fold metallo-hydrolase [Streptosporangiaceae bacterium]|nr:MBL fold metallo-hydrolase [Streptosporangiaceae bacterium]
MKIDILSSAGGRSSGYLLRHGDATVLVDCGPGTAASLARTGWLERLDAVVITHEHADHAADVIGLAYARRFPEPLPRIPLLAPPSALTALRRLDDLFAVPTLPQMAHTILASFELGTLDMDGVPTVIARQLRVSSYPVAHAVPSAALRFSSPRQTATFSSDTGVCDALIEAASNADLFLCEATYLAASAAELDRHGHLTPERAGAAASRAGAQRLVLTHLARAADATAAVAAASRHFETASITVAAPGTTICAKQSAH